MTAQELMQGLWKVEMYDSAGRSKKYHARYLEFASDTLRELDGDHRVLIDWQPFKLDERVRPVQLNRIVEGHQVQFALEVDKFVMRLCWKPDHSMPPCIDDSRFEVLTMSRVNSPPVEVEIPVEVKVMEHPTFGRLEYRPGNIGWEGKLIHETHPVTFCLATEEMKPAEINRVTIAEAFYQNVLETESKIKQALALDLNEDWKDGLSNQEFAQGLRLCSFWTMGDRIQATFEWHDRENDLLAGHCYVVHFDENMNITYLEFAG